MARRKSESKSIDVVEVMAEVLGPRLRRRGEILNAEDAPEIFTNLDYLLEAGSVRRAAPGAEANKEEDENG